MTNRQNDSKAYLVTGCAGFIASRVAALLVRSGHRVVGLDNVNDYYDTSLKDHRLRALEHERFRFFRGDIEDGAALKEVFDGESFDAVFNLAARAGVRY